MSEPGNLMEQLVAEVEAARRRAAEGGGGHPRPRAEWRRREAEAERLPVRQSGRLHEMEPQVDSLSYIDFEDDDFDAGWTYRAASNSGDPRELENWMVGAALPFLGEAGLFNAADESVRGIAEAQLHHEYQTQGYELFWGWVIDVALLAGFDVYDSDTRTELFPAGTLCDGECCEVEVALTAEHNDGEHEDTARGGCPLCAEIAEDVGPEAEAEAEAEHRPRIVESLGDITAGEMRYFVACSCGWESAFYYNLRWLAEQEAAAHGGRSMPRAEAEGGGPAPQAEAEDIYTCSGCGVTLWCASMEHTLDNCESDCPYWAEDPRDQSAWCCAGSPGGECEGGSGCTMCACKKAEGGEAEQLATEARLRAEQGSKAEAERTEARLHAEQHGGTQHHRGQHRNQTYAVVTADQAGYYVQEVGGSLADAVRMAREEGFAFGPAPGIVVKAEDGAWTPAPGVATCTECFLPFEADPNEDQDECPSCRAELAEALLGNREAKAPEAGGFPFEAEGGA